MGKLRDSLSGLEILVGAVDDRIQKAIEQSEKLDTNLVSVYENLIKGGFEVLYSYLVEKFKSQKDSYDQHLSDTILQHKDANVLKFVAGIAQGKTDLDKQFLNWRAFKDKDLQAISGDLTRLQVVVGEIDKQIAKKKKRLLQSTKFKNKISGYESTLADLAKSVDTLQKGMKNIYPALNKTNIDKIKISVNTTLGELDKDSIILNLKTSWKNAEKAMKEGVQERRKFRQAGDLTAARKQMQQWVKEADEMEAEGEESEEGGDKGKKEEVDPKPKLAGLVFKIGSTTVATAKAGEYDTKTKQLVADVTWKIKGDDPLKYLQKKFKVEGDHVPKGKDSFAQELKLDKLLGNLVKATFKG